MTQSIGRPLLSERSIRRQAAACARISSFGYHLKGIDDALGVVAARPQLGDQAAHVHLGAALHERHLRLADDARCGSSC